jgi:hypothetical protein
VLETLDPWSIATTSARRSSIFHLKGAGGGAGCAILEKNAQMLLRQEIDSIWA